MGERGRVAALDGVRGVAVALVLVGHVWNSGPLAQLAPYGVTLFFLLSGYLITGLLRDELDRTGQIRWGRFAAKRAARLLPAFAVMVVLVLTLATGAGFDLRAMWTDALPGVLYVADFIHQPGATLGAFGHTWSLSVEEQFYAVWPLLLWAMWRFRRRLPVVALAGIVAWTVVVHGVLPSGTSLATNVGYLAAGSLLALLRVPARLPRVLAVTPLVWLGTISYALYLWHYPLLALLPGNDLIAIGLAVVIAWASTRFLEQPIRRSVAARLVQPIADVELNRAGGGAGEDLLAGRAERLRPDQHVPAGDVA